MTTQPFVVGSLSRRIDECFNLLAHTSRLQTEHTRELLFIPFDVDTVVLERDEVVPIAGEILYPINLIFGEPRSHFLTHEYRLHEQVGDDVVFYGYALQEFALKFALELA